MYKISSNLPTTYKTIILLNNYFYNSYSFSIWSIVIKKVLILVFSNVLEEKNNNSKTIKIIPFYRI